MTERLAAHSNLIDELQALGFGESEARVYVLLLSEHPATGYQIGKASGMPRSQVYEALGRLEGRGAVLRARDEKATLYRPVAPEQLLDRYAQEVAGRIAGLRIGLAPIYQRQDAGRLWNFTGRREALRHAEEMIGTAAHELMLVLSDADVDALRPALDAAHARGVAIGIMLTGAAEAPPGQVVRHPPHETELHGMRETLIVVADEREFLIASGHVVANATVTTNPNMVLIARQFIWMELFAQRIFARLGDDLLDRLDAADRHVLHADMIQRHSHS
ncbi:MAG: TrmB family transcriptional regulator [Chloroflexi bacterium]|nr:TrmB family transcriptional regulator [Chloroflexota bacterium]